MEYILGSRLRSVMQVSMCFFVIVSVLFTTNKILVSPVRQCLAGVLDRNESCNTYILAGSAPRSASTSALLTENMVTNTSKRFLSWKSAHFGNTLPSSEVVSFMDEDLFLLKAFSRSMKPSRIVPFLYRASGMFDSQDVTLTTLVTSDRFPVLRRLVESYEGPISVTIHVKNETARVQQLLDALHELYTSSRSMSLYLDVHLVIDAFDRQFNTWRNIARFFARTDYIMMLDVDFAVCTDFRKAIRESQAIQNILATGQAALVVPAFEYVTKHEGSRPELFPKDKKSLLSLVKENRIEMFHSSWQRGHNSTDYERFYRAAAGEVYKVKQYQPAYEPYVIFKKEGPSWCDERFVGYGGNKAACIFEMYLSGVSFYVLADHFLIHQNHKYEETARKNERKYNRKVYADYKEETCFRYLKQYHESGLLNTTIGYNVQDECRKVKGISQIGAQLIDGPQ